MKSGNKKGAISLSVNVLVVLVLSFVIFGLGITFLFDLLDRTSNVSDTLNAQTEAELERLLLDTGRQVALYPRNANLERGGHKSLGLGITNTGVGEEFSLDIEFAQATNEKGNALLVSDTQSWFLYDDGSIKVQDGTTQKVLISVQPPKEALPGEYTFNVRVKSLGEKYGNTQKLYVTLK